MLQLVLELLVACTRISHPCQKHTFVLSKQGRRVERVHAGLLATVHSSVRERLAHLLHSSRHAETAHLTLECQRSLPGDAQPCLEEPLDDPCNQNNLSGQLPS